jgi:tol-pal system protein YbgF
MKYLLVFFIFILLFSNTYKLYAQDTLTTKQQLERIIEEVKDLNKAVFNKSFDQNKLFLDDKKNDVERFTSIDIRIYDLEKDIKNLTLQFEEIIFKLDDLTNNMKSLELEFFSKFENIKTDFDNQKIKKNNEKNFETTEIKEENTLGKLIISDNSQILSSNESNVSTEESVSNKLQQVLGNLSKEEQLQFALDQMMKKNYDYSKEILEDFIKNFPDDQLSGSAHYWLGKIYLFETNFRKAAIIFGEGVQKFPKSIKAAEMYYELIKSLKELNKIPEACKTFILLSEKYKASKFAKDPEKIKNQLNCEN